ncbi:MAG: peptidoglycan-binding domain-containing protein [Rickettsiales bacterium]
MNKPHVDTPEQEIQNEKQNTFVFLNKYFDQHENASLKKGDKSPEERAAIDGLQKFLQQEGLYKGKIDQDFGRGTKKAVEDFQKAHDLPVTGEVNAETFSAIKNLVVARHQASAIRGDGRQEAAVEAALDNQRRSVIMTVENAVNEERGTTRVPVNGIGDFFHNLGVITGATTQEFTKREKEMLLDQHRVNIGGTDIDLSEDILRSPEKLRVEMQKMASAISGGESENDFTRSALGVSSVSNYVANKNRGYSKD